MIIRTPKYYKEFECIAGDCPDSCCQGWEVDADSDSLKYYSTLAGDIKNKIDSVLDKDEFGNTIFKLVKNKRCPFLNSENLCDMHIAIGGEHTPYTCRTFPRFINDFGGTREVGLSLSCPVASDIIFNLKEPLTFTDEYNDLPPTLNEIDAQTYFYLVKMRKSAFDIIQNRDNTIIQRLDDLLDLGVEAQKNLDDYPIESEDIDFIEVFNNPEVINDEWVQKVKNHKIVQIPNETYIENIVCYFIYRYFITAVFDYDVLSKIKMAVVGALIVTYFGSDSWSIHLWSKETEHSQYNMDRYKSLLRNAKCLSVENLKKHIYRTNQH